MKATRFVTKSEYDKKWYLIDAQDKVLGRLCSNIASILRGKHQPTFTPNSDTGDFVVVINAGKVRLTGKKTQTKTYQRYSGYPSGQTKEKYTHLQVNKPEMIITHAVKGMLPHNKLGRAMLKKLKVCAGPKHPYQAQKPELITIIKERT